MFFNTTIYAHSGNTNSNGCHNDNKNGGYHCHNGGASDSSSDGASIIILAVAVVGIIWYLNTNSKDNQQSYYNKYNSKIDNLKYDLKVQDDVFMTTLAYRF